MQAVLRQDIAYFDEKVSTGEIIEKMSSDTNLIHDAIGEKVRGYSFLFLFLNDVYDCVSLIV